MQGLQFLLNFSINSVCFDVAICDPVHNVVTIMAYMFTAINSI